MTTTVTPEIVDVVLQRSDDLIALQAKQNEARIALVLAAYTTAYIVFKDRYPQTTEDEAHAFSRFITETVVKA